jgi:hypothetical protein
MRFILQLFYAPAIRTVSEAQALTARRREATASQLARFRAFTDAVEQAGTTALDVDAAEDAVLVVTLSQPVDRALLSQIARSAASAGLHLLDPQNGRLYRADGCLVRADGSIKPASLPLPSEGPALTAEAVLARVRARFAERFVAHGFVPGSGQTVVRRGETIDQKVCFDAEPQGAAVLLRASVAFQCPDVSHVWQDALGDAAAPTWQRVSTEPPPDVTLKPSELALGPDRSPDVAAVHSLQEADQWTDAFCAWFAGTALPRLNAVRRAADLGALALSDTQLRQLPRRQDLPPGEQYSRLVLAAAFDPERLALWTDALRGRSSAGSGHDRQRLDQLAAFLQA